MTPNMVLTSLPEEVFSCGSCEDSSRHEKCFGIQKRVYIFRDLLQEDLLHTYPLTKCKFLVQNLPHLLDYLLPFLQVSHGGPMPEVPFLLEYVEGILIDKNGKTG